MKYRKVIASGKTQWAFRSKGTCQKQDGNVNWCHHVTATCFHIHVIMFTICVMCHAIIACFSRVMASVTYKELYWKPKHSPFAPSKKIQNQVTIDKRIISLNLLHTLKQVRKSSRALPSKNQKKIIEKKPTKEPKKIGREGRVFDPLLLT